MFSQLCTEFARESPKKQHFPAYVCLRLEYTSFIIKMPLVSSHILTLICYVVCIWIIFIFALRGETLFLYVESCVSLYFAYRNLVTRQYTWTGKKAIWSWTVCVAIYQPKASDGDVCRQSTDTTTTATILDTKKCRIIANIRTQRIPSGPLWVAETATENVYVTKTSEFVYICTKWSSLPH